MLAVTYVRRDFSRRAVCRWCSKVMSPWRRGQRSQCQGLGALSAVPCISRPSLLVSCHIFLARRSRRPVHDPLHLLSLAIQHPHSFHRLDIFFKFEAMFASSVVAALVALPLFIKCTCFPPTEVCRRRGDLTGHPQLPLPPTARARTPSSRVISATLSPPTTTSRRTCRRFPPRTAH